MAAFYGLPPDRVVRNQPSTQQRPLPMNVALYLIRTLSGATYEHAARELGIRSSEVVSAGHRKVAHQRRLDPDLARQLAAIEAELTAIEAELTATYGIPRILELAWGARRQSATPCCVS